MSVPMRIPQSLYARNPRSRYDGNVASDGLTVDSPFGPVDLVAVDRVRDRRPTPVTRADIQYVLGQLPDGLTENVEPLAIGLGITPDAVRRAFERRKAAERVP